MKKAVRSWSGVLVITVVMKPDAVQLRAQLRLLSERNEEERR